MVKVLQRKFIFAAMTAITILLVTLVAAINIVNTVSVIRQQNQMLDALCEMENMDGPPGSQPDGTSAPGEKPDGTSPSGETGSGEQPDGMSAPGEKPDGTSPSGETGAGEQPDGTSAPVEKPDGTSPSGETGAGEQSDGMSAPGEKPDGPDRPDEPEKNGPGGQHFSMDDALSRRYFTAWFDENGNILRVDTSRIYAVTEKEAVRIAGEILAAGKTRGRFGDFRFLKNEEKGALLVMDVAMQQSGLLSVLGISVLIAALCWLAMLLPVHILAKRAIAPTVESIERQKQFVTNAGHELKTPLAIILANTDALELYNGETKWTRNIRAQAVRLSGLMQNLLTLSKMDENSLRLKRNPVPLHALVREVWENFAQPAEGKNLQAALPSPEDGEITVLGDQETLTQLLSILFDNAVKYTPQGGEIRMQIMKKGGKGVLIQSNTVESPAGADERRAQTQADMQPGKKAAADLTDNCGGRGAENIQAGKTAAADLTESRGSHREKAGESGTRTEGGGAHRKADAAALPEDPERLFDRFYRADADRSRKKGGYGIGLSAARAIAGANRGTIHASRDGNFLQFTVELPLAENAGSESKSRAADT